MGKDPRAPENPSDRHFMDAREKLNKKMKAQGMPPLTNEEFFGCRACTRPHTSNRLTRVAVRMGRGWRGRVSELDLS